MEMKKDNDDVLKKHIEKLVRPIFEKAAQETSDDPMMVGRVSTQNSIKFLWQPHNYRRYYDFSIINFEPITNPSLYKDPTYTQSKVGFEGTTYSLKNHNSEHHFNNFYGCRVIIRKHKAEVINKWYEKNWVLIEAENIKQVGEKIDERIKEMNQQCDNALKELIRTFGGGSDFKVLKQRGEHGIHGEDFLDKIPENMVIQDTIFKKVYKRKVEMYNPAFVKNYISNRAIEDISPEISKELKGINEALQGSLTPTLLALTEQIKLHLAVQKETKKTMKDIRDYIVKKPTKKPNKHKISPIVEAFLSKAQKEGVRI